MTEPSLIDRLERRFDRFAIPGLIRAIAGFQVICFILLQMKPGFVQVLALTPAAWQNWEIWRFISFTFIPGTNSLIFIIFVVMILILIGDQLEAEWGKFRLNLYYFATVVCLWGGVLLSDPVLGGVIGAMAGTFLYSSLFLAFAMVLPNYTFMLFFVLPVKVKWLAMLNGAILLWQFMTVAPLRLPILLALIPFACFALPIAWKRWKHGALVSSRREAYQSNSLPAGTPFHACKVCGRTDVTDPTLEFRIAGDDEEYCAEHLPAGPVS